MTTEFKWEITDILVLQQPQPNYVVELGFKLTGVDGETSAFTTGRVAFDPANPSESFVDYESIDELTLIRWVKQVLTEQGIASQEAIVQDKINAIVNPPIIPQKAEFPWLANTFTIE